MAGIIFARRKTPYRSCTTFTLSLEKSSFISTRKPMPLKISSSSVLHELLGEIRAEDEGELILGSLGKLEQVAHFKPS